jgi:hypothetical protein
MTIIVTNFPYFAKTILEKEYSITNFYFIFQWLEIEENF